MEHVDMNTATDLVFDAAFRVVNLHDSKTTGYSRAMGRIIGEITYYIAKLPKDEGDKLLTTLLDSLDSVKK